MNTMNKPTSIGICEHNNKTIVYTMLHQIQYPNIFVFGSWGAKGFTAAQSNNEAKEPCLKFKVNGRKFKICTYIL